MKVFLRVLSVSFFVGAIFHVLDLFDLRLRFSEMPLPWKAWTLYLLCADLAAAIGLWKQKRWGIVLFLVIACSQLTAYLGFRDYFGNQDFLVAFHTISITMYLVLRKEATR